MKLLQFMSDTQLNDTTTTLFTQHTAANDLTTLVAFDEAQYEKWRSQDPTFVLQMIRQMPTVQEHLLKQTASRMQMFKDFQIAPEFDSVLATTLPSQQANLTAIARYLSVIMHQPNTDFAKPLGKIFPGIPNLVSHANWTTPAAKKMKRKMPSHAARPNSNRMSRRALIGRVQNNVSASTHTIVATGPQQMNQVLAKISATKPALLAQWGELKALRGYLALVGFYDRYVIELDGAEFRISNQQLRVFESLQHDETKPLKQVPLSLPKSASLDWLRSQSNNPSIDKLITQTLESDPHNDWSAVMMQPLSREVRQQLFAQLSHNGLDEEQISPVLYLLGVLTKCFEEIEIAQSHIQRLENESESAYAARNELLKRENTNLKSQVKREQSKNKVAQATIEKLNDALTQQDTWRKKAELATDQTEEIRLLKQENDNLREQMAFDKHVHKTHQLAFERVMKDQNRQATREEFIQEYATKTGFVIAGEGWRQVAQALFPNATFISSDETNRDLTGLWSADYVLTNFGLNAHTQTRRVDNATGPDVQQIVLHKNVTNLDLLVALIKAQVETTAEAE